MRIIVGMSSFTDAHIDQTDLHALFYLGCKKRHRILTVPEWNPIAPTETVGIYEWLQRQDFDLRLNYESVLQTSLELEKKSSNVFTVQVSNVSNPTWDSQNNIAILPISKAVNFLNQPLKILLEDNINDRNFLLAVFFAIATEEQRKQLDECLKEGWIEFENGCGLGGVLKRVEQILTNKDYYAKHRTWVMFDSDALRPRLEASQIGGPSKESNKLKNLCSNNSIYHHQLERRAIENYLPLPVLHTWMTWAPHKSVKQMSRKRLVNAFSALSAEQRHYFNLKNGFQSDLTQLQQRKIIGHFYDDIANKVKNDLARGFGENIAELFTHRDLITKECLIKDGQTTEIEVMLEEVLALV